MANRPVLHKISFAQGAERAIDDPRLGSLAAEGWTIGASFAVAVPGPDGEIQELHLILWPPRFRRADWTWVVVAIVAALQVVQIVLGLSWVAR